MKNTVVALAKTLVTLLFFYFVFRRVNVEEFFATLRGAQWDILFVGFMVLWVGHYICIFRWRMLMRPLMLSLSLGQLFGIYCIGLFFNLAFPTVVGGDVVKMYYAGKPSKRFAQSFAATFLDRDAGMFAMMIIACIGVLIHPTRIPGLPVLWIIWSAFVGFVVANIVIFTPYWHRLFTSRLHKLRLSRLAVKVDTISSVFREIGKHGSILAASLVISLLNQLLVIAVTWIMALGLHIDISLLHFLIFVPVITLISMIPVSLNGMGLREYAFAGLFGAIGVARESCVALGLLSSVLLILSAIPGGVVYIFFRNRAEAGKIAAFETDFS